MLQNPIRGWRGEKPPHFTLKRHLIGFALLTWAASLSAQELTVQCTVNEFNGKVPLALAHLWGERLKTSASATHDFEMVTVTVSNDANRSRKLRLMLHLVGLGDESTKTIECAPNSRQQFQASPIVDPKLVRDIEDERVGKLQIEVREGQEVVYSDVKNFSLAGKDDIPMTSKARAFELQDGPLRDGGVREAACGRCAPAAASAALPCQNSNNSDKLGYKLRQVPNASQGVVTDSGGKHRWLESDDDTLWRMGMSTGAEARMAYHLRLNAAAFIEHWGRNHCLFFTVTDEENLHPTQFARRWNNYLRRHGSWILSFIRVLEPQRQGRPHYHVLVAVLWDTGPDAFDWLDYAECQRERKSNGRTALFRELRGRYRASAVPQLVALWRLLRQVLPRYGLGRAELLPIRKCKEAISEYIGKYLEAGLVIKKHSWKGCRRVEFDRHSLAGLGSNI